MKTFADSKCGLLNARSRNNNWDSIYELILITNNDLDVLALTETWWTDNSDVSLGLVTPPGYAIVQTHRSSWGSGVGVIYRDSLHARLEKCEKYSSFEQPNCKFLPWFRWITDYHYIQSFWELHYIISCRIHWSSVSFTNYNWKTFDSGGFQFPCEQPIWVRGK